MYNNPYNSIESPIRGDAGRNTRVRKKYVGGFHRAASGQFGVTDWEGTQAIAYSAEIDEIVEICGAPEYATRRVVRVAWKGALNFLPSLNIGVRPELAKIVAIEKVDIAILAGTDDQVPHLAARVNHVRQKHA